jgi:hypothetical protein
VSTFAEDIEQAANGEPILAVVIGEFGWRNGWGENGYGETDPLSWDKRGVPLLWTEARPLLNYEYNSGYGAPCCHAIYAWTISQAIFVVQYDGSTWLTSVPRNPVPCHPNMPGG